MLGIALVAALTLSPVAEADINYRPFRVFDDAAWVWTPAPGTNRFFRFRTDFASDGAPLVLHVSADERYILLLDGAEISRGPARGMVSHWFCQKVTAAPKAGPHRLEAVVWTLGAQDAPLAQLSYGGGFFLKAEGAPDAALTTGKGDWRVAPLVGTAPSARDYPRAFGCGSPFVVRGTSVLGEEPAADAWRPVVVRMKPRKPNVNGWGTVTPGWCVSESALPEMMMRPVKTGEIPQGKIAVAAHAKFEGLYDLGDYYCAYPFLTVSGGRGAKIRLGFAECLVDKAGKKIHRDSRNGAFTQANFDTFLPDGRVAALFTVPWWRCGKWCKLEIETGDEPLTVTDFTLRETRYPLSLDGSFAAEGDDSLAAIGRLCRRGVEMCAHEIMFDCPFYEQLMYGGDVLMSFAALRAMTRDVRLPCQGLALFDSARMPSGLVPMNWPCQNDQRGSTWTLSWVAAIGELAQWGGEEIRPWLKDRIAGVTHTLLSYARIENGDGLLVDPPGWNYLDWTKGWKKTCYAPPNGVPGKGPDACINLLYLQAMERTAGLAAAIGDSAMADYWRARAERLAAGIRKTFWDEDRGMIADTPAKTSFSEHAVALSIATDCLPKPLRDRSFAALESADDLSRASYMLHLVFTAYFRYGRGDLFLKKLDQWRGYLAVGLRCPLEAPEFPRSDCHAFASTPYYHFHAGLAGVKPSAPFFAKVRVAPAPGSLASVRAETPHPKGLVGTDFRFGADGGVRGAVTLPAGVTGEFVWKDVTQPLHPGRNDVDVPGASVRAAIPWPEHPRPDWERPDWVNLNGAWDFGFKPGAYDRLITVPFGWGSPLSGVPDEGDRGYYRRRIRVPDAWKGRRVFLVVGACDHDATVRLDGRELGRHSGGYLPFEFELTDRVRWGAEQELAVDVWDFDVRDAEKPSGTYLTGKQGYGNVRGIWQTPYLEARGTEHFAAIRFTPDVASKSVTAAVRLAEAASAACEATLELDGRRIAVPFASGAREASVRIAFAEPKLWTPETPHLYGVVARLGTDEVRTYFGFRTIGVGRMPGTDQPYVTLNGTCRYLRLALAQGYDANGYYTYPDERRMKSDLELAKRLGLTGLRAHVKVELPRWLYWADRLGLLVMADVPNMWNYVSERTFAENRACHEGMVARDFNHPSVFAWILFNESWGLFSPLRDAGQHPQYEKDNAFLPETQRRLAEHWRAAKAADPTRLVEDNSTCNNNHVTTDLNTWHDYLPAYRWEQAIERRCEGTFPGGTANYAASWHQTGAPLVNSECGGVWGYTGYLSDFDFSWDYHWMMDAFRRHPKCAGWVFTELHDVCNEWCAYVLYDRRPKYPGWDELFPGFGFRDLHADVTLPLDRSFYRCAAAGEVWRIPVHVSIVTDRFAGREFVLWRRVRRWGADGRLTEGPAECVHRFRAASWQHGLLAEVPVELPREPAAGVVCFWLTDGEKVVARNFAPFAAALPEDGRVVSASAEWSRRSWAILDGLKLCGAGEGHFDFAFDWKGTGPAVFRAELSSRPLYPKDTPDGAAGDTGLDFGPEARKFGLNGRAKRANSYPMTTDERHPSHVRLYANGRLVKEFTLSNDPCDHRGLLSWIAQPHDGRLRDAGTYGELVEVTIPADCLAPRTTIRLAADGGLAVYGPRFGRYPAGPTLVAAPSPAHVGLISPKCAFVKGNTRSIGAFRRNAPTGARTSSPTLRQKKI